MHMDIARQIATITRDVTRRPIGNEPGIGIDIRTSGTATEEELTRMIGAATAQWAPATPEASPEV